MENIKSIIIITGLTALNVVLAGYLLNKGSMIGYVNAGSALITFIILIKMVSRG